MALEAVERLFSFHRDGKSRAYEIAPYSSHSSRFVSEEVLVYIIVSATCCEMSWRSRKCQYQQATPELMHLATDGVTSTQSLQSEVGTLARRKCNGAAEKITFSGFVKPKASKNTPKPQLNA